MSENKDNIKSSQEALITCVCTQEQKHENEEKTLKNFENVQKVKGLAN